MLKRGGENHFYDGKNSKGMLLQQNRIFIPVRIKKRQVPAYHRNKGSLRGHHMQRLVETYLSHEGREIYLSHKKNASLTEGIYISRERDISLTRKGVTLTRSQIYPSHGGIFIPPSRRVNLSLEDKYIPIYSTKEVYSSQNVIITNPHRAASETP